MPNHPTIVSLIASATEIACGLDLRSQLVGRSHECDYPDDVLTLPVVSAPKVDPAQRGADIDRDVRALVRDGLSVYRVLVDELERLHPDLILTQDHCEVCAVSLHDVTDALCQVARTDTAVCTLHPTTLADVRRDFRRVATAAGVSDRGEQLVDRFDARLDAVRKRCASNDSRPRVALIEWLEPPMIAGGWMPELATLAGLVPVIVDAPERFATVTWDDISEADPDLVVIMPCGYTIEKTMRELEHPTLATALRSVPAVTRGQCYVADGNAYFNRPGPRLAESAEILAGLAFPKQCPDLLRQHKNTFVPWPNQGAKD